MNRGHIGISYGPNGQSTQIKLQGERENEQQDAKTKGVAGTPMLPGLAQEHNQDDRDQYRADPVGKMDAHIKVPIAGQKAVRIGQWKGAIAARFRVPHDRSQQDLKEYRCAGHAAPSADALRDRCTSLGEPSSQNREHNRVIATRMPSTTMAPQA